MPRTKASDPLQKYKFRVSIPGLPSTVGFQKASGLSREINISEYDESGYDATHKMQGREKVGDITLERGVFPSKDIYDLYKSSLQDADFRKTITISHLDKNDNIVQTWTLAEAWVSKWEGTDFDASSDDVAIEKITITFEKYVD